MLAATIVFWAVVTVNTVRLARADKCATDVRGWGRLLRFLWLTPGVMWPIWRLWTGYFRPDFHPWQHDNREHVATWKAALA
jgi:predicted metal-dependent hydrolase